jgi:hypothetical protein
VKRDFRRTPKGYNGPLLTTHHAGDVAAEVMIDIAAAAGANPTMVLATWPSLIGHRLAAMTEAVSFLNGVLLVRVKNSTLYSLLSQREKPRLLAALRKQLPNTTICDIVFRMS